MKKILKGVADVNFWLKDVFYTVCDCYSMWLRVGIVLCCPATEQDTFRYASKLRSVTQIDIDMISWTINVHVESYSNELI